MATKRKLQVFISSTYNDLKIERQAAVEAILKAGHIPAGMELFSAGSESQLETIRRWIDESDVYMLILGGRYGSVDPKTSLSYTELEYDYAVSKDKPFFAVVVTEAALDQKVKLEGKAAIESENPKELKLFREKVLGRISSFFSDAKDIKLAVHETLADFQIRHEFTGWVSAKELPDVASLLDELARLKVERDDALQQLSEAKANVGNSISKPAPKWQEDELKEIQAALKSLEIATKVFNQDETKPATKYSVLAILVYMRDRLITGVDNRYGINDIQKLLYYNICPKLEMYELAEPEKVTGVSWQRYRLTNKGKALLVYYDKQKARSSLPAASAPSQESIPITAAKQSVARSRKVVVKKLAG